MRREVSAHDLGEALPLARRARGETIIAWTKSGPRGSVRASFRPQPAPASMRHRLDAAAVAAGGARRAQLLDREAHLVEPRIDLTLGAFGHMRRRTVADDVPVSPQEAQRLATRRAARVELAGDVGLDPAGRPEFTVQPAPQLGVEAVGRRRRCAPLWLLARVNAITPAVTFSADRRGRDKRGSVTRRRSARRRARMSVPG